MYKPAGEGVGSSNSDDWRESLAFCLLCDNIPTCQQLVEGGSPDSAAVLQLAEKKLIFRRSFPKTKETCIIFVQY